MRLKCYYEEFYRQMNAIMLVVIHSMISIKKKMEKKCVMEKVEK